MPAKNSFTFFRSKPDFAADDWEWDIRIGEVRLHLDRKLGDQGGVGVSPVNSNNTAAGGVGTQTGAVAQTNDEAWESNLYSEGSIDPGLWIGKISFQYWTVWWNRIFCCFFSNARRKNKN